jgi:hypothetical protein
MCALQLLLKEKSSSGIGKTEFIPLQEQTIRRQTVREILKILIAREEKKIELRMNKDFFY